MKVINHVKPFKVNGEEHKVCDPRTLTIENVWNANKLVQITFPDGDSLEVHADDLRKAIDNATGNERLPNPFELKQLRRDDLRLRAFKERNFDEQGYDAWLTWRHITLAIVTLFLTVYLILYSLPLHLWN